MTKHLFQLGAILTVALGMPSAFAAPTMHPEIIGGVDVASSDPIASSTVMLFGETTEDGKPAQYICSASIIAQDILVTAAHCVAEDTSNPTDPAKLYVIFGQTLPGSLSDPSVHHIYKYQYNPGWQGTSDGSLSGDDVHDIAVIRFQGGLPSGFAPATILPADFALDKGQDVTLAGYGITTPKDTTGSTAGTLRKVDVKVLESVGQTEVGVSATRKAGMCSGDSGGPAFVSDGGQLLLWGVTSRGDAGCTKEGIYTRITAYTDWINQAMNQLEQAQ